MTAAGIMFELFGRRHHAMVVLGQQWESEFGYRRRLVLRHFLTQSCTCWTPRHLFPDPFKQSTCTDQKKSLVTSHPLSPHFGTISALFPIQKHFETLILEPTMPLLRSRKLTCFYCGCRSAHVQTPGLRQWTCENCEAENWLDEVGGPST